MNLYRIINNTLIEPFPDYVKAGDVVYTNGTAQELALKSGMWHPLIIKPVPNIEDGQILTKNYYLEDGTIYLDWVVTSVSSAPVDE